jgi:hypothetical protein
MINLYKKEEIKESFSVMEPLAYIPIPSTKEITIPPNNLIINGSFENGKDSPNHMNQNGYNKIIMKKNPGKSSYVLEQKKSDELTYYELSCKNVKNSRYNLYFWFSINNKEEDIKALDFEKLIKVKMQNEDYTNYVPRLNYNIIQKVLLSNDSSDSWYLIKYDFISDGNTVDKMNIYFNYAVDLQYDIYYFTNISLYRVLIDAENFIYNDDLISYLDGYSYESTSTTWRDVSGLGNDFVWSNIPITDYTKGSINCDNLKLTGFETNKISNNTFSILFCLNKNEDNKENSSENSSEMYLLSLPGNDRYALEVMLLDNYLYIVCGKDKYKSKNEIILYNKSLLSIQYNDGLIYVIYDGMNILTENIRKIYFNNNAIIINKDKNLNYNFYSILFYNRIIENNELNDIREYFITNKNKNSNKPDINAYHMNLTADYTSNMNSDQDNYLFKAYNNKVNTNSSVSNLSLKEVFDNQNNTLQLEENCLNSCLLNSNGNINNFIICGNQCKGTTITVDENQHIKCPKVYKKNGKYIVYVPPNSLYSEKYSGEKSYGTNIDKARYTYSINFPKCPIPDELIAGSENKYIETCPYVINELNPCYTTSCGNVNWNVKNYNDLNLNNNCKKSVSNYCQINYKLDDNCVCWDPKNRSDPTCIEFRKYFENPHDYCSPSQFNIEEHPDFDKYIKKDNIPCWGCNLTM